MLALVQRGFVIVFFVLICVPGIRYFTTKIDKVDAREHRLLAVFPSTAAFNQFPAQFNNYVNDHFGFRDDLITFRRAIDNQVFGMSSSTSVLSGKSGWLFYLGDGGMDELQHRSALSPAELDTIHKSFLKRNNTFIQAKIPYLFVVVPDKQTVYSDMIPPGVMNPQGPSRLQGIEQTIKDDPIVSSHYLNLVPALAAARKAEPTRNLYFKTDSHWNLYGAAIGYQAIMDKLNEIQPTHIPVLNLPADSFVTEKPAYCDLYYMAELNQPDLFVHSKLVNEDDRDRKFSKLFLSPKWQEYFEHREGWKDPYYLYNPKAPLDKTVLILGDSFAVRMRYYLSDTFRYVVTACVQPENDLLQEMVRRIHPDFVIEERVERYFVPPAPPFKENLDTPFDLRSVPPAANTGPVDFDALSNGTWQLAKGANGQEVIRQTTSNVQMPVLPAGNTGFIEQITLSHEEGDTFVFQGWAVNPKTQRPFDALLVTLNSDVIAVSQVDGDRPDIAASQHNPNAAKSGFRFTLSFNLLRFAGPVRVFGITGGQKPEQYELQEIPYTKTALPTPFQAEAHQLSEQGGGVSVIGTP